MFKSHNSINFHKKINVWQMMLLFLPLIGLGLLLYFIGQKQIYQTRASLDVSQTFTVTDVNNQTVSCGGTTCVTGEDNVTIKFNDTQIQNLLNSLP